MILFIIQITSCAFMTGLIWTIQILHYPSFRYVTKNEFQNFHSFHSRNITFIVLPIMLTELTTAAVLAIAHNSLILWISFLFVAAIWLCTFFISVPLHNLLSKERNAAIISRLIFTNWLRTILWSTRLGLLIILIFITTETYNVHFSA